MVHNLITAKCGSKLFGLDTEDSDQDYLSLIIPAEGEPMEVLKDGENYFFHDISCFYDINACASPIIIPSYDAITDYADRELFEFWKANQTALADIAPNETYLGAIKEWRRVTDEPCNTF